MCPCPANRIGLGKFARNGCLWIVLLLCGLLLTACSGRESAVDQATAQGLLLVGNGPEPEGIDPLFTTSTSALQIQQALFEGLTSPDPRDLSPQPGVAERWEVDADGLRYRFFLRESARWSDGAPLTASDFLFAWRRMLDPEQGGANASLFYLIEGAEAFHRGTLNDFAAVGIRMLSPHEIEVQLAYPAPYFPSMLAHPAFFPVPEHAVRANGRIHDRSNPWTRPAHFVGNGPFVLKDWRPQQYLEVRPNPFYWDAETVSLNGIRFFSISDPSAEERAFQGGQLHLTEALPPSRVRAYKDSHSPCLRIDPYLGVYYVLINHRHPLLGRLEVRQALAASIGREVICDHLLGAGQSPAYSFTPPTMPGYAPPEQNFVDIPPLDLPPGQSTVVNYLYNTSDANRMIAEALREMWRDGTGLRLGLENVEFRTYLARRETHNFELARGVWIGDFLDPMTFLGLWQSGGAGSDWSGWRSQEFDALLAEANLQRDPAARTALLTQAEKLLLDQQVMIPIYHYVTVYLLRPEVTGWYPTLLDWHPWKHVGLSSK